MLPEIRYTDDEPQIAYQVLGDGDGDMDLVFAFDWASNVELIWQHPSSERFLRRLASFSRLVVFDTRGMGLSDPVVGTPSAEEWMDDVRAVMDGARSERAALVGHGRGAARRTVRGVTPRTDPSPRDDQLVRAAAARRRLPPRYARGHPAAGDRGDPPDLGDRGVARDARARPRG